MPSFGDSRGASNIGSFLDSVNARRGQGGAQPDPARVEAAEQHLLDLLRDGPQVAERLRLTLELPAIVFETIIRRLEKAGMLLVSGPGPAATIALTDDADSKRLMLALQNGPLSASDLGRRLNLPEAALERTIERLQGMGMVRAEGSGPHRGIILTDFARDALKVFQLI
jgi:DNA-binding IscR family transcriptional regulator